MSIPSDFRGLYDIRQFQETDRPFIMATALRGLYYDEGGWYGKIDKDIFMQHYKGYLNAMLSSPNVTVNVACLPDDADTILGYSILSADYQSVVYTFVKTPWRLKGIARSLVPSHPTYVTHITKVGLKLLSKINNPKFNPFFTP